MGPPKKRILVIDDEPEIIHVMVDRLKSAGFDCLEAPEPVEGLRKAAQEHPDLIVLDLMLPKMSGFGFLRIIRNNPVLAHIPVIVLTGLCDSDIAQEALDLGAKAYLTKGCEPQELLTAVQEYLF